MCLLIRVPANGQRVDDSRPMLQSLKEIARQFDFEEPDAAPNALPQHFYRHIAPSHGFPPFGSMRLTKEIARNGEGSFEFELGGGSMAARLSTAIIPILPLTDYSVSVNVRTEGLRHARARVIAWLHYKSGQPIAESASASALMSTGGEWETLTVEVHGRWPDAVDLVLELQVVQPAQFDDQLRDPHQPKLEDVSGRVWFDDVIVAHLPHVRLSLPEVGNLVRAPSQPEFRIEVSELTREELTARLRVFDLDGESVFDVSFPAPRGVAGIVRVPIDRCGWYRAVLNVTSPTGVWRRQSVDFTVLPPQPNTIRRNTNFGIVVPTNDAAQMASTSDLVDALHSGTAIVPIWHRDSGSREDQHRMIALSQMVEQLLRRNVELILALNELPESLAAATSSEPRDVLKVLATGVHHWQRYLDDLLVNFGLEVNRWQIGSPERPEAFWSDRLRETVAAAEQSFGDFVPNPVLYPTWMLDQSPVADSAHGYAMTVPYHIQPHALLDYSNATDSEMESNPSTSYITLQLLPEHEYSARQQTVDLMLRGLHAWRAGHPLINIAAPWSYQPHTSGGDGSMTAMPTPAFGAWRMLATQLARRTFIGELPMPEGMHCWLLRGETDRDAALVVWTDQSPTSISSTDSDTSSTLIMQLAAGPVTVIDAYGNTQTIAPINGVHSVPLNDLPSFVENANLSLVQFRGGVALEPTFVPAVSKIHEHQLIVRNPWNVTVTGTIRLVEEDDWRLMPNVQEFTIQAGAEVRLPLNIIPQRSILAGQKRIVANIDLIADQSYSMAVNLDLELGLENIDLTASWTSERNIETKEHDLIVTQAVTNHGKTPVHLDVYLLAENIEQTRRTIAGLRPGETAVRSFRIPNGAATLAGKHIRVGVAERDGLTRLNRLLTIGPARSIDGSRVTQASNEN